MTEEHEYRDQNIAFESYFFIDGFKERICTYTDEKQIPYWANTWCFLIATVLGISWIFRLAFNWKSREIVYAIRKSVYNVPTSQLNLQGSEQVRVSLVETADSAPCAISRMSVQIPNTAFYH